MFLCCSQGLVEKQECSCDGLGHRVFFHWDTFLSPCLHHWALVQNQLDCVYIVSSFALAFVRILSCSALTLCHIHYGDSFIPLSPDFVVRTVSHYFVLSTFNIFLLEKGQTNGSRDTMRSKCLHQPKFLILSVILVPVWFSKNAQVLSIRSKASNAGLSSETFLSDCSMPFSTLLCLTLQSLGSMFFKLSHLFLTLSKKYTVANAKAFYWPYKLVNTNLQAIPSSGALENILGHFIPTMKDNFWKNYANFSNQFVKVWNLSQCVLLQKMKLVLFSLKIDSFLDNSLLNEYYSSVF